jgi:hypothetical protein
MKTLKLLFGIYAVFAVLIAFCFVHDTNTNIAALPAVLLVLCTPPALFGLLVVCVNWINSRNPIAMTIIKCAKWTLIVSVCLCAVAALLIFAWRWVLLSLCIALFGWALSEIIADGVRKGMRSNG